MNIAQIRKNSQDRSNAYIKDCEDRARAYSNNTADRLSYEVGCLRAQVRHLCQELEYAVEEIGNVERMLMKERK
jgi:hypothetical protein